jgi:DNA-binding transcriptional LysR family regulator
MISAVSLRYFAEVVRAGSIRGAAERLHVAASAISRQISLLEEELGAPMLERGPGRTVLRLTAAGELMMRHVRHLDHELDRVRSEIEALKGLRKGHVRLGIAETFVREVIPDLLRRFNDRYPGVTYNVVVAPTTRLIELVGHDELDVVVTFNPPPSLRVKHVHERTLDTCVLVANHHPLAQFDTVKLSDCAAYGLAMPDETISAKREQDDMFARARIEPRKVVVTNSYEFMRSVAETGMVITLVNQRPGDRANMPGFRYVPIRDARVKHQRMTISTCEGRTPSPVVAVFIETVKREFEELEQA